MHRTSLEELFGRHYADWPAALRRFTTLVAQANLGFSVEGAVKEQQFVPQHGFPSGMPSFIYYYVAGTSFGSAKQVTNTSQESDHAYTSDGIGLNMGCPVRLARALQVLFALKSEDKIEPLSQLKAAKNHFAAVEELLWLTLWRKQSELGRGGELIRREDGKKAKDVDWFFVADGIPIYLEAKFRPTTWIKDN